MKLKRPAAILCTLAVVIGGTAAIAANPGSQEDPLLTLSYLDKVLRPQLESQVDKAVKANEADLKARLEQVVAGYEGSAGSAAFQTKTLARGESFKPGAGREFLLTSGSATALGALTDTTAGKSVAAGDKLELDHLYLTFDAAGGCTATGSATVMSR